MKLAKSRVTAQGQISVPDEVRRRLELVAGSLPECEAEDDRIIVRRVAQRSFDDLKAVLLPAAPQPRSLDELKEGIRDQVRGRHARR
jgi:AbrB family looped-hinge helix DNA binding protein